MGLLQMAQAYTNQNFGQQQQNAVQKKYERTSGRQIPAWIAAELKSHDICPDHFGAQGEDDCTSRSSTMKHRADHNGILKSVWKEQAVKGLRPPPAYDNNGRPLFLKRHKKFSNGDILSKVHGTQLPWKRS